MARPDELRALLSEHAADALILSSLTDIRWACGFTGSNARLILVGSASHFLTDGRYRVQATREVTADHIHITSGRLTSLIRESTLLPTSGTILFQSDHVTVAEMEELQALAPSATWKGVPELLVRGMATKTVEEVQAIRRAQAITEQVLDQILGLICPGMTEKELAAEIVCLHLRLGADRMSFDPIVASGPNSALPHASPGDRRLEHNDVVLLDFGCFHDGYASDMTRMVLLGDAPPDFERLYEVVRTSKNRAIGEARAGMTTAALDAVARDYITVAGHRDDFSHGLGHGIGLQTHEWPRVSHSTDDILPSGVVVTVEPGIYLPGRFGIRIEDIIRIREDGAEVLTQSSDNLIRI